MFPERIAVRPAMDRFLELIEITVNTKLLHREQRNE